MSAFLALLRNRFQRTNEAAEDVVPWELDDKHTAYEFVRERGWITPSYEKYGSLEEALQGGTSFGRRFVLKQPNRHSSKGVYLLESTEENSFIDLLRLKEVTTKDLKVDGPAPDYWLAEECVPSSVLGKPVPFDYKVYCFSGRPTLIIQIDRNTSPPQCAVFDGAFLPLEAGRHFETNPDRWVVGHHVLPRHALKILAMASDLSMATSSRFVSVDCYDGVDGPVFGEFTFAPGAPDVGMIRFMDKTLKHLDAGALGKSVPCLSGIDINMDNLLEAAGEYQGIEMSSNFFSIVAAGAASGDRRYGQVLSNYLPQGSSNAHVSLSARMISFLNGDLEQLFMIYSAIRRRSGFIVGEGRLHEFESLALKFHQMRAAGNVWHTARAAEIRLGRGDISALEELKSLAAGGYKYAEGVLASLQNRPRSNNLSAGRSASS